MQSSHSHSGQHPRQSDRLANRRAVCLLAFLFAVPNLVFATQTAATTQDKEPNTVLHTKITAAAKPDAVQAAPLSVAEIQQQVIDYADNTLAAELRTKAAYSRVQFKSTRMDGRLSFHRCSKPLSFDAQRNNTRSNRLLVKVRCEDEKAWSIYVPLNVSYWQNVVTALHPLPRNHLISANDVAIIEQPLTQLNGNYMRRLSDVIGNVAVRSIANGAAIDSRALGKPQWVKRGDSVMITASSNGISVKMSGIAMSNGRQDEQIRVRNQSSKRIIKARVTGPGEVAAIM